MVFCDRCNICVHQACYGILSIPPGPWLCKPCALGLRPPCQLCPNQGGALKATRGGSTWAHVACALWIPEVSIGCVERMEPITKISSIPVSVFRIFNVSRYLLMESIVSRISGQSMESHLCSMQRKERRLHPVLGQVLQNRLPRYLRFPAQSGDESHRRRRALGRWREAEVLLPETFNGQKGSRFERWYRPCRR